MAEYRWDNDELHELVGSVINDESLSSLEDLRAHTPVIAVAEVFYDDDDLFDRVARKSIGKTPCWLVACDDTVRSLTSGNGVLKGHNDEALGVEFYIKIDPARFRLYPEQAQRGHIFNLLTMLILQKGEDPDSHEMIPKMADGRPVWKIVKHPAVGIETLRNFGRIDSSTALLLEAAQEAHDKQLHLFDYTPQLPQAREEMEEIKDEAFGPPAEEGQPEPRDVGDDDPEEAAA